MSIRTISPVHVPHILGIRAPKPGRKGARCSNWPIPPLESMSINFILLSLLSSLWITTHYSSAKRNWDSQPPARTVSNFIKLPSQFVAFHSYRSAKACEFFLTQRHIHFSSVKSQQNFSVCVQGASSTFLHAKEPLSLIVIITKLASFPRTLPPP